MLAPSLASELPAAATSQLLQLARGADVGSFVDNHVDAGLQAPQLLLLRRESSARLVPQPSTHLYIDAVLRIADDALGVSRGVVGHLGRVQGTETGPGCCVVDGARGSGLGGLLR
eukprot:767760-Hanusia_phi.AAC.6